jgi:hypothetical protein
VTRARSVLVAVVLVAVVVVAGVVAVVAVSGPFGGDDDAPGVDGEVVRSAVLQRVNEFRTARGRAALDPASRLDAVAGERARGADATPDCDASVLVTRVTTVADETVLAGRAVDRLTAGEGRTDLSRRDVTELGVGVDPGEEETTVALVVC